MTVSPFVDEIFQFEFFVFFRKLHNTLHDGLLLNTSYLCVQSAKFLKY